MQRFAVSIAAATVFVAGASMIGVGAAPMVAPAAICNAADSLNVVERAAFIWLGHNYCWYDDGWNGPGWYWCDQYRVHGIGWGGGYGWHGGHAGGGRGGHAHAAAVYGGHARAAVVHGGHTHAALVHGGHAHAAVSHRGGGGHAHGAVSHGGGGGGHARGGGGGHGG